MRIFKPRDKIQDYFPLKHKLRKDFIPRWQSRMPKSWEPPIPLYDPTETNHRRTIESRALRKKKIALLSELVKKTKAAHPTEKKTYREWVLQTVKEGKHNFNETS